MSNENKYEIRVMTIDLQVGPVDGLRVDLHHPHRRDARRDLVVLRHEKGRPARCRQHRQPPAPRRRLVQCRPLCLRAAGARAVLRGAVLQVTSKRRDGNEV